MAPRVGACVSEIDRLPNRNQKAVKRRWVAACESIDGRH